MLQCSCLLCLTPSLAPFVAPMPYHDIWLPMEVNQDNTGYSKSLIVWMWDASLNLSAFHSANTLAAIWRMLRQENGETLWYPTSKTALPRRLILFPVAAVDDLINEALWGEDLWIRRWVAGCSCNYSIYALYINIYIIYIYMYTLYKLYLCIHHYILASTSAPWLAKNLLQSRSQKWKMPQSRTLHYSDKKWRIIKMTCHDIKIT